MKYCFYCGEINTTKLYFCSNLCRVRGKDSEVMSSINPKKYKIVKGSLHPRQTIVKFPKGYKG